MSSGTSPTPHSGAMQKAVIHAGFRKVGSSTIQAGLQLNQDLLSDTHHLLIRDDLIRPLRKAVMHCTRHNNWFSRRAIDTAITQIVSRLKADSKGRTIVVSDENLFGSFSYLPNGDTLIDWALIVLPKLEAALRQQGIEPQFIVYTRPVADWCKSAWVQSVRRKGFGGDFEDWMKGMPADFSWDVEVARLEAALSSPLQRVDLKSEAQTAPFLGHAVLKAADVAPDVLARIKPIGPQNTSPSKGAMALIQMVNAASERGLVKRDTVRDLIIDHPQFFTESPQT